MVVVAAALIAPDGSVCLQKRPLGKAHAGLWEFPGGKLEAGESPDCALIREISEELGVEIDPSSLVPAAFARDSGDSLTNRQPLVILLYTCRRWIGEVQLIEGEAIGWFAPTAIPALDMPPLDYPLAQQLEHLLRDGSI